MPENISDVFIKNVTDKICRNKRVKKRLGDYGKLSIERKLPYLLIYRQTADHQDSGMVKLILSEASYIITTKEILPFKDFKKLLKNIVQSMIREYGSYMVIEIWGKRDSKTFKVLSPPNMARSTIAEFLKELRSFDEIYEDVEVEHTSTDYRHPDYLKPIFTKKELNKLGCLYIGLEVPELFYNMETGHVFPLFFRKFKEKFSAALQKAIFDFVRVQTTFEIANYYMLGRSTIDPTVWHIDKQMTKIEKSYQYLLLLSPTNSDKAWRQFKKDNYEVNPEFRYRLLPIDPDMVKRKLYNLNIHKINDPSLSYLFKDKREELDTQLTLLSERNTPNFLYSAIRLYKGVDEVLKQKAERLLHELPPEEDFHAEPMPKKLAHIDAEGFHKAASEEFDYYKNIYPKFKSRIEIRNDVPGLMVSHGNLLIPTKMKIDPDRVDALIQHEVGTHVLTFCNGSVQPLKQMAFGLADYDELQEGLAVLAEYLVGGLTRDRMRLLAARVVTADAVIQGAEFVDAFRLLQEKYHFKRKAAFSIVSRIYSCGGFIKDLIYLRGLIRLMDHLQDGGAFEELFIGKIAEKHIRIIHELQARNVLEVPPLMPRYLKFNATKSRLEKVRKGMDLSEMIGVQEEVA